MKQWIVCSILTLLLLGATAHGKDTYVRGYTRANGTYVQGFHQTNINPYNGKSGTVNLYSSQHYSYGSPSYSQKGFSSRKSY